MLMFFITFITDRGVYKPHPRVFDNPDQVEEFIESLQEAEHDETDYLPFDHVIIHAARRLYSDVTIAAFADYRGREKGWVMEWRVEDPWDPVEITDET